MHAPCIVCGRRRGHDADEHARYRAEYRRCKNLLRRTWPRLAGLTKLLAFYASQEAQPVQAPRVEWTCKVHKNGTVTHHPVRQEEKQA